MRVGNFRGDAPDQSTLANRVAAGVGDEGITSPQSPDGPSPSGLPIKLLENERNGRLKEPHIYFLNSIYKGSNVNRAVNKGRDFLLDCLGRSTSCQKPLPRVVAHA